MDVQEMFAVTFDLKRMQRIVSSIHFGEKVSKDEMKYFDQNYNDVVKHYDSELNYWRQFGKFSDMTPENKKHFGVDI